MWAATGRQAPVWPAGLRFCSCRNIRSSVSRNVSCLNHTVKLFNQSVKHRNSQNQNIRLTSWVHGAASRRLPLRKMKPDGVFHKQQSGCCLFSVSDQFLFQLFSVMNHSNFHTETCTAAVWASAVWCCSCCSSVNYQNYFCSEEHFMIFLDITGRFKFFKYSWEAASVWRSCFYRLTQSWRSQTERKLKLNIKMWNFWWRTGAGSSRLASVRWTNDPQPDRSPGGNGHGRAPLQTSPQETGSGVFLRSEDD